MHQRVESKSNRQMSPPEGDLHISTEASLRDMDVAKKKLSTEKLSIVVVKSQRVIFTSQAPGVRGLVDAIRKLGPSLAGSTVADKVVGKAAALLCVYAGVSRVYGCVMSELGIEVLKRFSVLFEYDALVPNILNRGGTGICPFEKLVMEVSSPREAFLTVDRFLSSSQMKETMR